MDQQIKDTIAGIQMDVLNQVENYHLMAEHRATLSALYGTLTERLKLVLREKHLIWREWRKEERSDKATDRRWDATLSGLEEMEVKLDLKVVEKIMSALNQLIKVNQTDYWNTK